MREDIVQPVCASLQGLSLVVRAPDVYRNNISQIQQEGMVDETILSLLYCCHCPPPRQGRIPITPSSLREVLVVFALADANHHLGRTNPNTLEAGSYSKTVNVAYAQVIMRWKEVLQIRSSKFEAVVDHAVFRKTWTDLADGMLGGILRAAERMNEQAILAALPNHISAIPSHRASVVEAMLDGLYQANAGSQLSIETLVGQLESPSKDIRLRALLELTARGQQAKEAQEAIYHLIMADPSAEIRNKAHEAIRAICPDIDSLMAQLIDGLRNPASRQMCSAMLTGHGRLAIPYLLPLLNSRDIDFQRTIKSILSSIENDPLARLISLPPSEP